MAKREMMNCTPETIRRKREILEKVREGLSKSKIFEWIQDNYNVKLSQAQRLYRESMRDLEATFDESDINIKRLEYAERIESWIEGCIKSGNLKDAIKLQDMLNRLYGLYTEKKDINLNTDIISFDFN